MLNTATWILENELAVAILFSAAWKSSLVLLVAGGLARLLSGCSAAMRHLVWTTALALALVIPVFEFILPACNLAASNVGSLVHSALSPKAPAGNALEAASRRDGSIVAMLDGPALERTVLDQTSADDDTFSIANPAQAEAAADTPAAATLGLAPASWVLAAWFLGTIGMLVPLMGGILSLQRVASRCERPRRDELSRQVAEVAHEVGLGRHVTLLVSDVRAIPMTWGTLWPVLLLPREARNWPCERLRIVLLHELVHVARCDCLLQLVGAMARAVYWFNPLAWWGYRRLQVELEQACDDRVLDAGTQAQTYAFELLRVTSQFPGTGFMPSTALAIGRSARIQRRIESILDPSRDRRPMTRRFACVTAIAGIVVTAAVSSMHEARGQTAPATPQAQVISANPANATQATSRPATQLVESTSGKSNVAPANSSTQEVGRQATQDIAKNPGSATVASDVPTGTATVPLSEIRTQILKHFVKSPDERALDEGAIRGMLQALDDPHSEFLSPDKFKELERTIEGVLAGIGIEVSTSQKQLVVIAPLPGSPAEAAGLKPGDAITAVDGKTVEELGAAAAINAIRGKAGTAVSLRVTRAGGQDATMAVTRGSIRLPSVKGLWLDQSTRKWNFWLDQDQKLGYIHIAEFGKQTVEDCQSAVKALLDQGLKGLVVDLRHCPGGLLMAAVDVAQLFLREGTIVSVKGKDPAKENAVTETTFRATGKTCLGDFPLLVLVDEHTASAAEILAGALKENGRATILGTRTFGKGSVQEILTVQGRGAIKLTAAYFYLAGGRGIDRPTGAGSWGVDPSDGFYVPVSREQQDQWLKARRKWEIAGDALRGPHQGSAVISAAIDAILADPQLSSAYRSISARVTSGAFLKVGLSEQALREHVARREQLLKARAEAQKQLETIDKELSAASDGARNK